MFKLFKIFKPFRVLLIIVLVFMLFQSLSELYLPTLMADIVDTGIVRGDLRFIVKIGALMLLVAAIGACCSIVASFLSARIATGFGTILRRQVFAHITSFSLQEFDKFGTASLITRTTNDITQVQMLLMFMLRLTVSAPMMAVGGVIMAISKDAQLSLVLVLIIPVLAAAIALIAAKGVPLFKAMQVKLDRLNLVLRENLTGIRVIRAYNRINHEQERFNAANLDLTHTAIQVNRIMASLMPGIMLMLNYTIIAVIWFGSMRIDSGHMQVGDLMAFIQYVMLIMFSLVMFSMLFVMLPRASASVARINEVLDTIPKIRDAAQVRSAGGQRGFVEFKDVTFSYPGAERPALNNISFKAGPGEVTAIIGGTGAGKSTLLNLIPRFYDPDSGAILVNGVDIRTMTQESLRAKIGFVPQQAFLFSGTIASNIRHGKQDAADQEVQAAAQIAQATEFIDELKEGFKAHIAQGGANVSGGQRQRLAIARALVRKPEIYLFDDSFSALDFKTEAKLRAALQKGTAGATVLVVAQRVSTIMDADRIIVLENGQIVGIGTHEELLKTCKVYRESVSSQLAEEETA